MKKRLLFVLAGMLFSLSSAAQHIKIYCEDDSQFRGPDGKFTGLGIDIVSEIQKRVANTDQIQLVPWKRGLKYLDSEPNAMLFSMARTKYRNELYQWIGPISDVVYGFYAKADSKISINNLSDARQVASVGVYKNDIWDQFLTKEGFTNLDQAYNNFSNVKKLMAGHVVVIASSSRGIIVGTKRAGYSLNDVKFLYSFLKSQIYIAVSKKTDPKIVADWQAALDSMTMDGTLKRIFEKYSQAQELPRAGITNF